MKGDAVFKERESKNWTTHNFTVPNVKVGTVLEYSYTITSDFIWNLPTWNFQNSIPTQKSYYKLMIPEFFKYQFLSQGFEPISHDTEIISEEFIYEWRYLPLDGGTIGKGVRQMPSQSKRHELLETNIPAFIKESHVDSYENYISKVSFELLSTSYPGKVATQYMGNWEKLNATMLERSSFGLMVEQSFFLNKIVNGLIDGKLTDQEKLEAILTYVKSNVMWNGSNTKFARNKFKNRIGRRPRLVSRSKFIIHFNASKSGVVS